MRYSEAEVAEATTISDELGYFKMRYKRPGEATSTLIEQAILPGQGTASDDVRFSIAMAGFFLRPLAAPLRIAFAAAGSAQVVFQVLVE